jgi:hypothetical protein
MRDSKDSDGEPLSFSRSVWAAFIATLKAGDLDRPKIE